MSIRAEPHIAVVDRNAERHKTVEVARLYLDQFYRPAAQRVFARNHLRPSDPEILAEFAGAFPPVELFGVDAVAAGWDEAQGKFFADGGVFDGLFRPASPREPRE